VSYRVRGETRVADKPTRELLDRPNYVVARLGRCAPGANLADRSLHTMGSQIIHGPDLGFVADVLDPRADQLDLLRRHVSCAEARHKVFDMLDKRTAALLRETIGFGVDDPLTAEGDVGLQLVRDPISRGVVRSSARLLMPVTVVVEVGDEVRPLAVAFEDTSHRFLSRLSGAG